MTGEENKPRVAEIDLEDLVNKVYQSPNYSGMQKLYIVAGFSNCELERISQDVYHLWDTYGNHLLAYLTKTGFEIRDMAK